MSDREVADRSAIRAYFRRGQGGSFLADNESVGPKGPFAKTEKGEGPCVTLFIQRIEGPDLALCVAAEARCLHPGTHNDAEETEFGNA